MQTYCLGCKSHTDNVCSKKLIMTTNIKIKGKSRCADSLANKSFSDKTKNKTELGIIVSQFLIDWILWNRPW